MEISRKRFLAWMGSLIGWTLLSSGKSKAVNLKSAVLQKNYIAGWRYYHGPRLMHLLSVGERLQLRAEPDNPYDPRAVAVYTSFGQKLGYLPARANKTVNNLLRQGIELETRIAKINREDVPWRQVKIAIAVQGMAA